MDATTRTPILGASAYSVRVWVGQNHEMAEPGNPQGDIYDTKYHVHVRVDSEPWKYIHGHLFDWDVEAERLAKRIEEEGSINLDAQYPTGDPVWTETARIPYGCPGSNEQALAEEIQDAKDAGERHPLA